MVSAFFVVNNTQIFAQTQDKEVIKNRAVMKKDTIKEPKKEEKKDKEPTEKPQKSLTVQPTIMVIPFAKENENLRTVLENDINRRVGITKVKEGFDKRGATTTDFLAKLKQTQTEKVMEMDNKNSLKQQIIELSGADIYVETEVTQQESGTGNYVTVILTAYDAFTGQSLANKVCNSPKFYTTDYTKLTEKAVDACIDDFLNTMNIKFGDIVKNGRSLSMNITFAQGSKNDLDMTINDKLLSEIIEDWLAKNAYKKYYHVQGTTATKMIIDDVRVPLKDEKGNNYRTAKFVAEFRKFLKENQLECTRDIQGSKIFITIQ